VKSGLDAILQEGFYHEYLRRLDAQAVLDHYGAENQREDRNKDGTTEIIHSCLLDRVEPHHSNGDRNPSAACNLEKKKYVCYAGGWSGDLIHLVAKMEGAEFADSLGLVGQFLTGATLDTETFKAEVEKMFASGAAYSINLPSYDLQVIQEWRDQPHPYWRERGINELAREALMLGYDQDTQRIVFPHFVDGTLVGWQKRVIPGLTKPDIPKYKNSPGFPKSETLYNLDFAREFPRVCVVESPMSVARAVSLQLPNVVSTFGAKVGEHQIDLLKNFEQVYVWFDRDTSGIQGERKLLEGLYRHTEVLWIAPDRGKDMADCSMDEIAAKFIMAEPAALRLGAYSQFRRTHG